MFSRLSRALSGDLVFSATLLTLLLLASSALRAAEDPHAHHGKPEGIRQGVTSLDVCADGDSVHLLTASRDSDLKLKFEYQQSNDGGETFLAPVSVALNQPLPELAKRGQDVQIAAHGDSVVALWTTKGTENRFGRGPLATAISADGGKTWSAGPNPADDNSAADHSFADITADDQGTFHAVWLDARNGKKGLIYSRSTDGGKVWSENQTLVAETCECCWNTLAAAPGGRIYCLYRAKTPRDMAIIRSADGGASWSAPEPVGHFGWKIDACPHVGGGLAILGAGSEERLFATVWTGAASVFGTYFLERDLRAWSDPRPLGDKDSTHSDVAAAGDTIVATWDGYTETGTAIFAIASVDAGKSWQPIRRLSAGKTTATHPRVVATNSGFRIFWTEQSGTDQPRWASQRLALDTLSTVGASGTAQK